MRSGIFGIILTVILDFNEISDLSNQNFSNSVLFTKVNAKTCKKGLPPQKPSLRYPVRPSSHLSKEQNRVKTI